MSYVKNFRDYLEKDASFSSRTARILGGFGKAFSWMGDHPKTTIGVLGGGLGAGLATKGVLALGKYTHPTHQIIREEIKSKSMNEQNKILKQILEETKRKPVEQKNQKPMIPALS